jgi:hypothetical protein
MLRAWHASGLWSSNMSTRASLVMVVAIAALTMYPSPAQVGVRDPQAPVQARKVAPAPKSSVTVEHQLIQVEPMPRPKPPPRLRRSLPSTRLAYGLARQDTLATRARRAVFGDGRFRPEPFPRLDR